MTPKEYLQQYRQAVMRAEAAMDHLEELKSMATRITPNYDAEGGGTHQGGDKLGAAVASIIEAKSRVSDELEMLCATEREVIHTISLVNDGALRNLLYERYINGKTFEKIAVEMNYSYVHIVHRLHPRALAAVGDTLPKDVIECNIDGVL